MIKHKYIISALIVFSLSFGMININAIDYSKEEAKYSKICNNAATAKEYKEACIGYRDYLNEKVKNSANDAERYKGEINKYKEDLAKQVELAESYEVMVTEFNSEISTLESTIVQLNNDIKRIENDIIEREAEIAEKDSIIVDRMRKTQSDMRFGYEVDFLLKALDFSTLIASASVVSDIMEFERIQIQEIDRLIEEQKKDQEAIVLQQDLVVLSLQEVEVKKKNVLVLKAEIEIVIENYRVAMAEIAALQSQAYADATAVRNQMKAISTALETQESSTGFVRPISGGRLSAGVWAYGGTFGGMHLGNDYAAPIGTEIRAAANGYVLASSDRCPTVGYLRDKCGERGGLASGGNQVHLIVTVNNKIYGVQYAHMQSGTPIKAGQAVKAGQRIGAVGSSGNSSGPHTHVEVYYLGTQTITDYVNNSWNSSYSHGIGFSLNNRCMNNGNTAPCRLNPNVAFGSN